MSEKKKDPTAPELFDDAELSARIHKNSVNATVSFALMFVGVLILIVGMLLQSIFVIVVGFIFTFVCIMIVSKTSAKHKKMISDNVILGTLKNVFGVTEYFPEQHLSGEEVGRAGLVNGWNDVRGDDLFRGSYRGARISYSDIKLENLTTTTDSDGSVLEDRDRIFAGPWIICSLKRHVEAAVRVIENPKRPGGYIKTRSDVDTEDSAFNDKFQILTDDPHTAFLILTPQFMEYINSADVSASGRIMFCFRDSEVHIAVESSRNLFEAGAEAKDVNLLRQKMLDDSRYITGILDELFKNDYLFGEGN